MTQRLTAPDSRVRGIDIGNVTIILLGQLSERVMLSTGEDVKKHPALQRQPLSGVAITAHL